MSKLDELIKELCTNGVEYKNIKDVCLENFWVMPSTPKYQVEGVPYITSKNIRNGKVMFDDIKYITEDDYKIISSNRPIKENDFLISMIGTIGEVGIVKDSDLPFYGQNMYLLRLNTKIMNIRFFYHYFTSGKVRNKLLGEKNNGNQGYLKTKNIEMLSIPIPPIEVQEEIVRILDKFGELEVELEVELEARKSQYEFWRRKLLFCQDYDMKKMSDICVINQGLQIPINKRKTVPGNNRYFYITVQFLKGGSENYYIENPQKSVICNKEDILVTRTGSTGKIITGVEGCFHNNFFKVNPIIDINKKYLFHVLNSTEMYKEMLRIASGGTVPDLPHSKFYNMGIPVPTLEEQERLVNILDRFDKLVNDINEGIPAEIEARRKQYEYYRNKLLSFEEASCE